MKFKFLLSAILLFSVAGRPARPQQAAKPLNKTQVMDLVKAGMESAELAEKVKQTGIDFDLTDDYLQDLRKAGAKEVLINALRAARPKRLTREQVLELVAGHVPSQRAAALVKEHGIDFVPDDDYLETLRVAGAEDVLLAALRNAASKSAPPPKTDPSGEAVQHLNRGNALREKRDAEGAASEYREAIRLKPDYAEAHNGLCDVLPNLGGPNIDAAFPECHEALRLRPDYPEAHKNLAMSFGPKGTLTGPLLNIARPSASSRTRPKRTLASALRLDLRAIGTAQSPNSARRFVSNRTTPQRTACSARRFRGRAIGVGPSPNRGRRFA